MKDESKILRNMAIMFVVTADISKLFLRRKLEQWICDALLAATFYMIGAVLQDCAFSKVKIIDIYTRREIKGKMSAKDFLIRIITAIICGCVYAFVEGVLMNELCLFRSFTATIASFLGLIL